jgi:hypothetical protein
MVAVLDPLPVVAVHVVKAEKVGFLRKPPVKPRGWGARAALRGRRRARAGGGRFRRRNGVPTGGTRAIPRLQRVVVRSLRIVPSGWLGLPIVRTPTYSENVISREAS